MKFAPSKYYQNGDRVIKILGCAVTYFHKSCLLAEELDGSIVPVGEDETAATGFHEVRCWPAGVYRENGETVPQGPPELPLPFEDQTLTPSDGDPTAEDAPEANQAQSFEDFTSAPNLLQIGVDAMRNRAASRDNDGERSMAKTVAAFNALSGQSISEEDGWLFMVCLKLARSMNGSKKIADDYADGAAYLALQGECALREQQAANQPSLSDLAKQGRDSKRRLLGEEAGEGVLCGPANFYIAGEGWNKGVVYEAPEGLRIRYDGEPTKSVDLSDVDKVREIKPTS